MRKSLVSFVACAIWFLPLHGQSVTYATIQPILVNKCVSCHRPGDAAPFALTSYADVRKRLSFIREVITKGYMPPWRADVHYRDFAEFEQRMIGVTFVDHRLDATTLATVRERFEPHMTAEGAHFVRPMRVNLLRKRH